MAGVLLVEQNGHRLVHLPQEDTLLFEYRTVDSLGAECWGVARKLPRWTTGPMGNGMKGNTIFIFLLEMFSHPGTEIASNNSPAYSRTLEDL